jgi:hypothetical protein
LSPQFLGSKNKPRKKPAWKQVASISQKIDFFKTIPVRTSNPVGGSLCFDETDYSGKANISAANPNHLVIGSKVK